MSTTPRTVYFVPHTHWDREWYLPFEVFRARLVDVIDEVLDLLDGDPEYRRFTLDGQAIVLDDYLALRPERRDDVARQVRAGRLRIGPWYVLADEFLVSPEALVRNLALGREVCETFGPAMPIAYTPDSFGHIAQLPLLARGFGLDAIVFERGVGDEGERLRGEFRWRSADGTSEVFAVHLLGTYSAAAGIGHRDWELGDAYDPDAARRQFAAALYGHDTLDESFPAWLRESLLRVPGGMDAYATGAGILMLNGSDHLFPQRNVPQIVRDLDASYEHVQVVHADVEEFVRAAQRQGGDLALHQGEFRGSRYQHVLSGVLSARTYLKQANHRDETLLERYAEPLCALASRATGVDASRAQLRHAWRTLLENHPHDSICGCSIDAVHREMSARSERVQQLGADLCRRAVDAMARQRIDPRAEREQVDLLSVFAPVPYEGSAVVAATIVRPSGAGAVRVCAADGSTLPHQQVVMRSAVPGRSDVWRDRVDLLVLAPLTPLGLTDLRVLPADPDADDAADATAADADATLDTPAGATATLDADGCHLANEHLQVVVHHDGSITLSEGVAPAPRRLTLRIVAESDAGDEYDFSPVANERPRVARCVAGPEIVDVGPVRASCRLRCELELPERLADDRITPLGRVVMPIELTLGLDANARRLDVSVELDHRANDTRVRLAVASDVRSDEAWADGHFHVVRRTARPAGADDWFQLPSGSNHQRRFIAVQDEEWGLAVLNRGLPEYALEVADAGAVLCVTLLRAVGWLSRDDLRSRPQGAGPALATPEAQCHGHHRFELALVPFHGPWWRSALPVEAERFVAVPRAFAVAQALDLPGMTLSPPLTLSAFAPSRRGGGVVVRVWNPTPVAVNGALELPTPPRAVYRTRLDETREARVDTTGRRLAIALGPSEVATFELCTEGEEDG